MTPQHVGVALFVCVALVLQPVARAIVNAEPEPEFNERVNDLAPFAETGFDAPIVTGVPCRANGNNTFLFALNPISGGLAGYYTVEGCEGVQPKLQMERGVTYTFDQNEASNWMHPLGFAYYPDGEHVGAPELEDPVPERCSQPEFQCDTNGATQVPVYSITRVDDSSEPDLEGLDNYEAIFKRPYEQWREGNRFSVELTIPEDSLTASFYYFCHIHSGVSGPIEVVDPPPNADQLQLPFNPDTYYVLSTGFDQTCGTVDLNPYADSNKQCPDTVFLCPSGNSDPYAEDFNLCTQANSCMMTTEMSVDPSANQLVTFCRQMIPHHLNAINMAKTAIKLSQNQEGWEDLEADLPGLMMDIVNTQSHQIQVMQGWLDQYSSPEIDLVLCNPEQPATALRTSENLMKPASAQ